MNLNLIPILLAGAVGAIVMVMARIFMKKIMGIPLQMDVLQMLGNKMGASGTSTRKVGMLTHIAIGAVLAIPYAFGFSYFNIVNNIWMWGLLAGFIHWTIAGALLGKMPGVSAYAKNFGKPDVRAFLMGHLLYGLSVGIGYVYFVTLF